MFENRHKNKSNFEEHTRRGNAMTRTAANNKVGPGMSLADAVPHMARAEAFISKALAAAVRARREGGYAQVSLRLGSRLASPGYLVEWCVGDEGGRTCFPHAAFDGQHRQLAVSVEENEALWGYPAMDVADLQLLILSLRPTSKIKLPPASPSATD
jgi:hypothetical protein